MTLIKSIFLSITFIIIATASGWIWGAYTQPLLTLDTRNMPELPKRFRTTADSLPSGINTSGLSVLHIAGGAQFSALSLEQITKHLQAKKLTIIDLRQEPHGFLNGNAMSWYGVRNAINAKKSPKQIEADQSRRLNALGKQTKTNVYKILQKSDEGKIDKVKLTQIAVHKTVTEEALATHLHLNYQRIYVQDFHAPVAEQVDRFIGIVRQHPVGEWIYFHCRAGIGRTTTFMVMYDIMHNAKRVSLDDILTRQAALGGKDLRKLPARDNYKYQWAVDRLNFIKKFYQYARENNDNFATTWTAWVSLT